MNLDQFPKLCYRNKPKCPMFRKVDWIEETGICISSCCISVILADSNFKIFDMESYLRPQDRFFIKYLKQDHKHGGS